MEAIDLRPGLAAHRNVKHIGPGLVLGQHLGVLMGGVPVKECTGAQNGVFHQLGIQRPHGQIHHAPDKRIGLIGDIPLRLPLTAKRPHSGGKQHAATGEFGLFQHNHLSPGQLGRPDSGHHTAAATADHQNITVHLSHSNPPPCFISH